MYINIFYTNRTWSNLFNKYVNYRGYDSPLHYFNDKFKDRDITRKQLAKEDSGLYSSLRRRDLLDYAIPEKMRRKYWR